MGKYINFWNRIWLHPYHLPGCWLWTGPLSPQGYGIQGRKLAHRYVYEHLVGPIPPKFDIDHVCHNRACVNPDHLRAGTHKQNLENHRGARSDSKSGVRGVYWLERTKSWRAQVGHNGKQVHVGYFKTLEAADLAARAARNELFSFNDFDQEDLS